MNMLSYDIGRVRVQRTRRIVAAVAGGMVVAIFAIGIMLLNADSNTTDARVGKKESKIRTHESNAKKSTAQPTISRQNKTQIKQNGTSSKDTSSDVLKTTTSTPISSTSDNKPVADVIPEPVAITQVTTTPKSSNLPFEKSVVGYWSLNGTTQGVGGNGTVFGDVTYVNGKFGKAAHFDGNSYIEVSDNDNFSPATFDERMTVSFWFKPDTYSFSGINEGYVNFLGKASGRGQAEWEFRLDNETAFDGFSRSKRMNFYVFNSIGGLGAGSALNDAAPLDIWTHIVGEVDGTFTRLYINGQQVDQDLLSDYNIKMTNTSAPLRIGTSDKEACLQGSISNVIIYNRVLSNSEVSQLYNASY